MKISRSFKMKINKFKNMLYKIRLFQLYSLLKIINNKMNKTTKVKITYYKKFPIKMKYQRIIQISNTLKTNKILRKYQKNYKEEVNFQKNSIDGSKNQKILIHINRKNNWLLTQKGLSK